MNTSLTQKHRSSNARFHLGFVDGRVLIDQGISCFLLLKFIFRQIKTTLLKPQSFYKIFRKQHQISELIENNISNLIVTICEIVF